MRVDGSKASIGRVELVALIAMMFATISFSIDAVLPVLPQIANELIPADPKRAALILTAFVFGMGMGTFAAGPLSDAFGRKSIVLGGSALYIICAAVAAESNSIEIMLIARVFQGMGAAGPRVVSAAVIRDLYSGREMARIVSIVLLVFSLVPATAPAIGALIATYAGWRGIFYAFMLFATICIVWAAVRLPETLPRENRRPLRPRLMVSAVAEMLSHTSVSLSICAQTLAMAMLFSTLMLVQPIYADVFNRAESFPYWFGAIALVAGSASVLNAMLVMRFGMQRMITTAFGIQILLSCIMLSLNLDTLPAPYGFTAFLVWQAYLFFQGGLTLGNLNAIAMEPMGHIAGMAASVTGAVSMVIAAGIASVVGLGFDGTTRTLIVSVMVMATISFVIMVVMAWFAQGEEMTS